MYYLLMWPQFNRHMQRDTVWLRMTVSQPSWGCCDIKMTICQPVSMETIITSEQDLKTATNLLPEDLVLIHFKLVGVGPQTLAKAGYLGSNVCEIVRETPGFFVVSRNGVGLREAMHDLVDRFCNAQEGKS